MTGNPETPRAQRRIPYFNAYLLGPLSRMIIARAPGRAANAPIKAVWRNERGPIALSNGQSPQ